MIKGLKLVICLFLCTSCAWIYTPDVTQGNYIDEKQYRALKTGMSQSDVYNLLGTPMTYDMYDGNVWYYLYRITERYNVTHDSKLTLRFQSGRLMSIEGDGYQAPPEL